MAILLFNHFDIPMLLADEFFACFLGLAELKQGTFILLLQSIRTELKVSQLVLFNQN